MSKAVDTVIRAETLDLTFRVNDGPVYALKDVRLETGGRSMGVACAYGSIGLI